MENYGAQIRSGDYQKIIEFAKEKNWLGYYKIESSLPDIIKSAYSNDFNIFLNILKFIRDLPYIFQLAVSYSALYDEMKRNNYLDSFHLMMLAYAVKESMEMKNYPDIAQSYKDQHESLKSQLEGKRKDGVEKCAAQIKSGDYQTIIEWAKKLNRYEGSFELAVPDLIKSAYLNDFNIFLNILKFIRDLPDIDQCAVSYSAMYDEMKRNNHLEGFQLMILAYAVKESMEFPNYPNIPQRYKDKFELLNRELKEKAKAGIEEGGVQIRNGFYEKHLAWAEKINKDGNSFELAFPDLITFAYAKNLNNFENILKFIQKVNRIQCKAVGLSALYDEMKANNHLESYQLMMLGYSTKEIMEMKSYSEIPQRYKDKLERTRDGLPSNVISFIWSSTQKCTIKNAHYKEYLYSSDAPDDFDDSKYAFTWIPGNEIEEGFWSIQTENNGKTFTIQSAHSGLYLFVSDDNLLDDNQRSVFLRKSGEKVGKLGDWRITPKNGKFLISNLCFKDEEFLFGSLHILKQESRFVYTSSANSEAIKSEWEINC